MPKGSAHISLRPMIQSLLTGHSLFLVFYPIGLICEHIIELRLLGFKLVWLAAGKWNQYNSHFTGKLDQLQKALYQDIETRFSHYYTLAETF